MTDSLRTPRRSWRAGLALAIVMIGVSGLGIATSWTNFREVDEGRFYRSGQLSDAQLMRVIDEYQIRTIINLRGEDLGDEWYQRERAVASERGVALVDVDLRAYRLPHKAELIRLLDAYRDAERPILVHCFSGADRAGQASAIYQLEYMGASKQEALEMVSWRFLHLSLLRPAMRYFIERYRDEQWARSSYDPCRTDYRYYNREKFCNG